MILPGPVLVLVEVVEDKDDDGWEEEITSIDDYFEQPKRDDICQQGPGGRREQTSRFYEGRERED